MPHGFVGKASQKYLATVSAAMESAHAVHSVNPLAGMAGAAAAPPSVPVAHNHRLSHQPDSARSGSYSTGLGNQSNIVVKDAEYRETTQMMTTICYQHGEAIYNMLVHLEKMCDTVYIVPHMKPKYLELVNKAKSSLEDFQTLTDKARISALEFIDEIARIDEM